MLPRTSAIESSFADMLPRTSLSPASATGAPLENGLQARASYSGVANSGIAPHGSATESAPQPFLSKMESLERDFSSLFAKNTKLRRLSAPVLGNGAEVFEKALSPMSRARSRSLGGMGMVHPWGLSETDFNKLDSESEVSDFNAELSLEAATAEVFELREKVRELTQQNVELRMRNRELIWAEEQRVANLCTTETQTSGGVIDELSERVTILERELFVKQRDFERLAAAHSKLLLESEAMERDIEALQRNTPLPKGGKMLLRSMAPPPPTPCRERKRRDMAVQVNLNPTPGRNLIWDRSAHEATVRSAASAESPRICSMGKARGYENSPKQRPHYPNGQSRSDSARILPTQESEQEAEEFHQQRWVQRLQRRGSLDAGSEKVPENNVFWQGTLSWDPYLAREVEELGPRPRLVIS